MDHSPKSLYDIASLSLWTSVGIALIVGAIQAAGWRHRVLIFGLIGLGALCIFAAFVGPLVAESWPFLNQFMTLAAASPSSWFTLLMYIAALVVFSRPLNKNSIKSAFLFTKENGVSDISTTELAQKLRLEMRDLQAHIEEKLIDFGKSHLSLSLNTSADLNAVAANSNGDIERLSQSVEGYSAKVKNADLDLLHVLNFAVLASTVEFLTGLYWDAPSEGVPLGPEIENGIREERFEAIESYIRRLRSQLSGSNRASDLQNLLAFAEKDGESSVRQILENINYINPLDLRRYVIANTKREQAMLYLRGQKHEVLQEIRALRGPLIMRLNARNPR